MSYRNSWKSSTREPNPQCTYLKESIDYGKSFKHKLFWIEETSQEHWLLFQRTFVQFLAPTWWLTNFCYSSTQGIQCPLLASSGIRQACAYRCTCRPKPIYIKYNYKISLVTRSVYVCVCKPDTKPVWRSGNHLREPVFSIYLSETVLG